MAIHRLDELWHDDTDEKLYRRTGQTMTEVSPSTGGTGEGQINYAKNPLQESSVNFLTYSGFTPVWATTYNLYGGGAIKCTMTSSGTGRYLRIALDDLSDAQITEMLRLSFFYKLTEGGDDAVRLSIWNGTNHTYLTPEYLVSASGDITKYDGWTYSISQTSHYLQFTFKDSTAITLYLADLLLTPRILPQGAVISEWEEYPLQITATTTSPTRGTILHEKALWRRVGSSIEIKYRLQQTTGGTAGSGIYLWSIPSGLEIDLTKMISGNHCGTGRVEVSGSSEAALVVGIYDSTRVYLKAINPVAGTIVLNPIQHDFFHLGSANINYHFILNVPISGWTSSINLVTEAQEFAFNTQATVNTNDTTSFGYGPDGTPILANTQQTIYDIEFKSNDNPLDLPVIEFRSIATGAWIPAHQAVTLVGGLYYAGLSFSSANFSSVPRGVGILPIISNKKYRVVFGNVVATISGTADKTWAQLIADATHGYDRWRVRKISNGNAAEAPASGIYESGQNANGYYVKYVDGTMVQWMKELTVTNTGASAGSITATLPTPFADTNYSGLATKVGGSAEAFGYLGTKTTTTVIVGGQQKDSSALGTIYVDVVLFGKWNLSRSVAAPGTPVGESAVFASASGSGPVTLNTPIQYNTVVEDSLGCITTGSSWKFTAPVNGLYLVTGNTYFSDQNLDVHIYKNGTQLTFIDHSHIDTARASHSIVIRLNRGDYIDLRPSVTATNFGSHIQITRLSA